MEVVDHAEIITKNAEFARVFGVDFASVMFRGSQYKVESFMFRIAKPESFVLVSPSKQQVGLQNAPFAVPLIAEPESKYYNHPILVLDFQSLYPSVMIAYNICFSTCLGRVEKFKGTDKFGFTELKVADGLMELLKDYLTGQWQFYHEQRLTRCSDPEWNDICQAGSAKESLSKDAGRDFGHPSHGQTRHESGQR